VGGESEALVGWEALGVLTDLGRRAVVTGLKLRELFVLPQLAAAAPSAS
jgi:hypothetical protein